MSAEENSCTIIIIMSLLCNMMYYTIIEHSCSSNIVWYILLKVITNYRYCNVKLIRILNVLIKPVYYLFQVLHISEQWEAEFIYIISAL